jgi:hypothetical protein
MTKALAHKAKRRKHLANYIEQHPDMVPALVWAKEQTWGFVADVYEKLLKWGNLSEKQAQALKNAHIKAQMKAEDTAHLPQAKAPEGKLEVTGTVISIKDDRDYDGLLIRKRMLVELSDRARVFGTIPQSISDVAKGDTVTFTGTFSVSGRDESFGFFSRPRKASINK